jgi:hypothetical protein
MRLLSSPYIMSTNITVNKLCISMQFRHLRPYVNVQMYLYAVIMPFNYYVMKNCRCYCITLGTEKYPVGKINSSFNKLTESWLQFKLSLYYAWFSVIQLIYLPYAYTTAGIRFRFQFATVSAARLSRWIRRVVLTGRNCLLLITLKDETLSLLTY